MYLTIHMYFIKIRHIHKAPITKHQAVRLHLRCNTVHTLKNNTANTLSTLGRKSKKIAF